MASPLIPPLNINISPGKCKFVIFVLCYFSLDLNDCAFGASIIPSFLNLAEGVTCGEIHSSTKERILGGSAADLREFPFLASIQKEDTHFCSAFIIQRNKLISAAHCFLGSQPFKEYQIVIGSNDWTDRSNASNLYRISSVRIHPEFSYLKPNVENDIALLTLDRKLNWGTNIQPICLAPDEKYQYDHGIIAGWGMRSQKESLNEWMKDTTLHKVSLPIWRNSDCEAMYRKHRVNWNTRDSHVCAGHSSTDRETLGDTSLGDSGSPLVVIGEGGNRIAYGIVSVGEGPVLPGIYTRLSAFSEWIAKNS